MEEMTYVDKAGKEYLVLQNASSAHLYEDGYKIFEGNISDIENLGLKFLRKGFITKTGGKEL